MFLKQKQKKELAAERSEAVTAFRLFEKQGDEPHGTK